MTPELARYLEEALGRLRAVLDLEALYLFGSHARGTATQHSDLDLLVLWETDLPPLERIGQVDGRPGSLDAGPLTPEDEKKVHAFITLTDERALQQARGAEVCRPRDLAQRANLLNSALGWSEAVQVRGDVPVAHAPAVGGDGLAERVFCAWA